MWRATHYTVVRHKIIKYLITHTRRQSVAERHPFATVAAVRTAQHTMCGVCAAADVRKQTCGQFTFTSAQSVRNTSQ